MLINLKIPDYLIIGAGTAGSVLARKLSDDTNNYVVALHNGPNRNQNSLITLSSNSIIAVLNALIGAPLYALGLTTPQFAANNRTLSWVYALSFGGASAVNANDMPVVPPKCMTNGKQSMGLIGQQHAF